ncbi:MAG: adenylosuccinate synthetase [bacterium]|nr:adenylosuccinate synthetase [bacterium]
MIPNPERPVSVIVGLNRGDEGKGRFTDMWAEHYDMIARYACWSKKIFVVL